MVRRAKKTAGFSIVELLIVLVITTFVLSAIITLFINITILNKDLEYRAQANKKMDSMIEGYRNTAFDSLANATTTVSGLPSGQAVLAVSNNIDGAAQTDIKKIDLTISWTFKRAQSVHIVTLITRNGIHR